MAGRESSGGSIRLLSRRWRRALLFLRHGWLLLRGGVLRWRLETFGLYMPSLPNDRPWWRVNAKMAVTLLRHRERYAGWLVEMRALSRDGSPGWWRASLGSGYSTLRDYVDGANGPLLEPLDSLEVEPADDGVPHER